MLRAAFAAFDELELSWRFVARIAGPAGSGIIGSDAMVASEHIAAARRALGQLGFLQPRAHGRRMRSLLVAYDQSSGTWVQLGLRSEPALTSRNSRGGVALRVRERTRRLADRLSGTVRRRGIAVALLGPDGAGKSTVAAAVGAGFYFPADYVYMGLYQAGVMARRGPWRPPGAGLAAALARQWHRWLRSQYLRTRGRLVLFDRYTYDALLPAGRPLSRLARIRRVVLARACPRPTLVVVLDAPGDVLYERKGEHDVILLERQRRRFLELAQTLPACVVVDAAQDAESVAREVTAQIWRVYANRWA